MPGTRTARADFFSSLRIHVDIVAFPRTMFKAFQHLPGAIRSSCTRHYSQQLAATAREGVASTTQQLPSAKLVQYPYYIPRNTRGSLPVYSDIRNNGTRILVQIRNIEGNVEVMPFAISLTKLTEWFPSFFCSNLRRMLERRC